MFGKNKSEKEILTKKIIECPLFSELSGSEIKTLLGISHVREYGTDEMVFNEGTVGLCFYIIVKGSVELGVMNGSSFIIMKTFKEGEYFSAVHLFSETNHSVSCVAKEVTKLLIFAKPDMEELIKSNPKTGTKIVQSFLNFFGSEIQRMYVENLEMKKRLFAE